MVLIDFIKFLGNPKAEKAEIETRKKIIDFVVLFVVSTLVVYGYSFLLSLFIWKPVSLIHYLTPKQLFIGSILLAPLLEEATFRLSMVFSRLNLSISLALFIPKLVFICFRISYISWTYILLSILCFAIIYIFLNYLEIIVSKIENFWKNHFKFIFYSFSLLFGIVHMTNYYIADLSMLGAGLLFCVIQFVGGLCIGYLRLRFGFWWAVLMHFLFNSVPFVIMLIFY